MEVTRQLRTERTTKKGLVPVQTTFCWDRSRLRISSGEKCEPRHWNPKQPAFHLDFYLVYPWKSLASSAPLR
jgi:hypothetical protein